MADNILEYKGYHTIVRYNGESNTLHGVIEGIEDYVNFECVDLASVQKEFHDAVDEYLDYCKQIGKEPDKEYKGSFNIRIQPELHKKLAIEALANDESINRTVERAITAYLNKRKPKLI